MAKKKRRGRPTRKADDIEDLDDLLETCGTASSKAEPAGEAVEHIQKAPCSVEFSRDAKGQARWGLKVYGERDEMEDVIGEVLDHDRRLRKATKSSD